MVTDKQLADLIAGHASETCGAQCNQAAAWRELQLYREGTSYPGAWQGLRAWVRARMEGGEDAGAEEGGEGA